MVTFLTMPATDQLMVIFAVIVATLAGICVVSLFVEAIWRLFTR
jgi:hypothetical protein